MLLNRKVQHAITLLTILGEANRQSGSKLVTTAAMSAETNLSVSGLEQILAPMARNGLVEGFRGPGGGYCVARGAERYTLKYLCEVMTGSDVMPKALERINLGAVANFQTLQHKDRPAA